MDEHKHEMVREFNRQFVKHRHDRAKRKTLFENFEKQYKEVGNGFCGCPVKRSFKCQMKIKCKC